VRGGWRALSRLAEYRSGPVDKNVDELRWKRRNRNRTDQLRSCGAQPRHARGAADGDQRMRRGGTRCRRRIAGCGLDGEGIEEC
jgi:hypothetical protein